jgi:site-specific DNA recombinase
MNYAFGYARKSPDDKNNTESSLTNQVNLIESYCNKNNLKLIDTFIDTNISGNDRKRKEFLRMIDKSILFKKEHSFDSVYIIVKDQDRFCRDTGFFQDKLIDFEAYDIRVFSIVKNNFFSYEDLGDVVKSVVDVDDIYDKRRKAKILFEQKKESGLPPIKAPFGYKNKNKMWIINKRNSEIVKEVCKDYLEGINYRQTIERLKISIKSYYSIISNVKKGVYSGYIVYYKRIKDSNKNIVRTEEIKYPGKQEKIISEEIFIQCQGKIKN